MVNYGLASYLLSISFQRQPVEIIRRQGLPNSWHDLPGNRIRTDRGDQADKGDAGVPEFDRLRGRLFHSGIEGRGKVARHIVCTGLGVSK